MPVGRASKPVPHDAASWTAKEVVADVWGHSYVGVAAASSINQVLNANDVRLVKAMEDAPDANRRSQPPRLGKPKEPQKAPLGNDYLEQLVTE